VHVERVAKLDTNKGDLCVRGSGLDSSRSV